MILLVCDDVWPTSVCWNAAGILTPVCLNMHTGFCAHLHCVCVCHCVSESQKKQSSFSLWREDKHGANRLCCYGNGCNKRKRQWHSLIYNGSVCKPSTGTKALSCTFWLQLRVMWFVKTIKKKFKEKGQSNQTDTVTERHSTSAGKGKKGEKKNHILKQHRLQK